MVDEYDDSGPALIVPPSWSTEATLSSHVAHCARCQFVLLLGRCHHPRQRRMRRDPGE
jgi:hypothetical protein